MIFLKEAYYFSHDANARHDPKISAMRGIYGAEGYGWYWMLVEMMREANEYRLDMQSKYAFHAYALQMNAECTKIEAFVRDCIDEFSLFESDGARFWSPSLVRRMSKMEDVKSKRSAAAKSRWDKGKAASDESNGMQMHSECNPHAEQNDAKERKGKERKVKDKKISSRQVYAEDSLYFKMASYFHKRIMEYAKGINVEHLVRNANLQVWADDFRKLVEIDKRDKDEARRVMEWVSANVFWRKNILSPDKLRKQYSRVCIEMADTNHRGGQGNAQGDSSGPRHHDSRDRGAGKSLSIPDNELNQLFAVSSQ